MGVTRGLLNTEDTTLWRDLCKERHWEWKERSSHECGGTILDRSYEDTDDEGMGDDEEEYDEDRTVERMLLYADSTHTPMDVDSPRQTSDFSQLRFNTPRTTLDKPDYKLLFQTHTLFKRRIAGSEYSLSTLQTSGSPNGHNNTIYCLQLYTYPDSGMQVLFTGSKDRTIREWDLASGAVVRVFDRVHRGSVLSISASDGLLVSGGSDYRTIRTYRLPDFTPEHVLTRHRAAVNAVSVSGQYIASASGDRSMGIWDAETGQLLQMFDNHHGRGLASIDFRYPYVLSGSSDRHLRFINILTNQGWSTAPHASPAAAPTTTSCPNCGNAQDQLQAATRRTSHKELVRSVALTPDFVISGSYDHTVKVWDRETGSLLADLAGGHTGRIFCVDVDCAKIVSCGEDQRICIWDFSHGIDTSFIKL
ncbi:hypothetical protein EIP86_011541 [Pleurotus ostreatoroseus]|nr:hypothetical protein EIP86_011541 [Pleurotus ostreatoroseus]